MTDIPPQVLWAADRDDLADHHLERVGLYGPWREREAAIVAALRDARPDIVVLTESWAKDGDSQCARLAHPLGLPHHTFSGVAAQEDEAALSGVAVMSRWPIRRESSLTFGGARVQFAELAGPRGRAGA
jgi:endonuclease/exonuclease/phosphatase family metal-dependent hydrolase